MITTTPTISGMIEQSRNRQFPTKKASKVAASKGGRSSWIAEFWFASKRSSGANSGGQKNVSVFSKSKTAAMRKKQRDNKRQRLTDMQAATPTARDTGVWGTSRQTFASSAAYPVPFTRRPPISVVPFAHKGVQIRVPSRIVDPKISVRRYIGTVLSVEGQRVRAEISPAGDADSWEVYLFTDSFKERLPEDGEQFELKLTTTSSCKMFDIGFLPPLPAWSDEDEREKEKLLAWAANVNV